MFSSFFNTATLHTNYHSTIIVLVRLLSVTLNHIQFEFTLICPTTIPFSQITVWSMSSLYAISFIIEFNLYVNNTQLQPRTERRWWDYKWSLLIALLGTGKLAMRTRWIFNILTYKRISTVEGKQIHYFRIIHSRIYYPIMLIQY